MDKTPKGTKPGILFVNSKLVKPDEFGPKAFQKWYESRHIPDIFVTDGIKEATRWEALDTSADRPYLALYPLEDLDFLQTPEFKAISVHDKEQIPGSGAIFDYADFDTRYYRSVQLFEQEKAIQKPADLLIVLSYTPTNDRETDEWYRQQHCREVSTVSTWHHTERYELTFARQNRKSAEDKQIADPPRLLTLHYFTGESFPEQELGKLAEDPKAQEIMSAWKDTQVSMFKLLSHLSSSK